MVEGAPHTAKRSIVVSMGCPLPAYEGVEEGEGQPSHGAPKGGVLLLVGVGFPLPLLE